MQRRGRVVWTLAAVCMFGGSQADAAGVYEDAGAASAFLIGPQRIGVEARVAVTSGETADAFVYSIAAAFPVRGFFLLQVEQPFVAVSEDSAFASGMGDLVVRARLRLLGRGRRTLSLLTGLGVGTGDARYYPYSSESIDIEAALGYADSLGAVRLWVLGGGVAVRRAPQGIPASARNRDHLRVSAGAALPLERANDMRVGAAAYFYETDERRVLYFAEIAHEFAAALRLAAGAHVEAGPRAARVSDTAVTVAATILF